MKDLFQKLKLPIIVMAALVAGFILYNSFIKKPTSTSLLDTRGSGAATSTPDRDFLPLLLSIQNVNLDQKIFIDPVFRALIDWSQTIVPESVGKQNPFSGVLGASSANSSVESLGFTETTSPGASTRR